MTKPKDKGVGSTADKQEKTKKSYKIQQAFSTRFSGLRIDQGAVIEAETTDEIARMKAAGVLVDYKAGPEDTIIDYDDFKERFAQREAAEKAANKGSPENIALKRSKAKAAADKAYKDAMAADD